jgi:hypothetical protein
MLLYLRLATIEAPAAMKIRKLLVLTLVLFTCLVVPCGRPQDLPSPAGSDSAAKGKGYTEAKANSAPTTHAAVIAGMMIRDWRAASPVLLTELVSSQGCHSVAQNHLTSR